MKDAPIQEAQQRANAKRLEELSSQDVDNPKISPLVILIILKKIFIVLVIIGIICLYAK
jgi:hypothetical protein